MSIDGQDELGEFILSIAGRVGEWAPHVLGACAASSPQMNACSSASQRGTGPSGGRFGGGLPYSLSARHQTRISCRWHAGGSRAASHLVKESRLTPTFSAPALRRRFSDQIWQLAYPGTPPAASVDSGSQRVC